MTAIILATDAATLRGALSEYTTTATVEAEYGQDCVAGTVATLAHHGPRSVNPCPCLGGTVELSAQSVVGISHVDLDTLGGIMRILGRKDEDDQPEFWELAAFVDVNGVHKLPTGVVEVGLKVARTIYDGDDDFGRDMAEAAVRQLNAWWAWSESHRCPRPERGQALDVTQYVEMCFGVLARIFDDDADLLSAGEEWATAKAKLEADSRVEEVHGVVLRQSDQFTNHLYGPTGRAVVALNTRTGAVTCSLADPVVGVSCCEIMQGLFGPTAGGHAGIAGTPRDQQYTLDDARRVADALREVLL